MNNKSYKVLIVDDEKDILEVYRKKFELEGYQVETTDKGKEALKKAINFKPDVILLDILMLDISGYKVIKQLKTDRKVKNIPVIMLSNLGHGEAIEKCIINGADDYIVKVNYTPKEIAEKVGIFLKEHK